MDDREAYEFYADPENRKLVGKPRKRNAPRLTSMTAVRFAPETIEAVKDMAHSEGVSVGAWIRRLVSRAIAAPAEPEMTAVTLDGFAEPLQVRSELLRDLAAGLMPALLKYGSVSLTLGAPQITSSGPASMTTAMPFTLNAPRPQALVPGSGRKGEPKALRSSLTRAATFACPHMSIGNATSASCGICGPLARVA